MILYEFYCSKHGAFEALDRCGATFHKCPECGALASKVLVPPRIKLDGTDPAFSTAYQKWAKVHEDAAKRAYKRDDLGGQFNGDN